MILHSPLLHTTEWSNGAEEHDSCGYGKEFYEVDENSIIFMGRSYTTCCIRSQPLATRLLSKMTLYEAWSGKTPHFEHIKIFCCLDYMKLSSVHVKKLDDGIKVIIIWEKNLSLKLTGYTIHKIYKTRDVIFEKTKSSLWEHKVENELSVARLM